MAASAEVKTFRKLLAGATKGEVIIPLLQAILYDPRFSTFTITIPGFEKRPPDGWFHPSTHPLWTPRQLYYYLAEPDRMDDEPFDPTSTMAVTAGTFWHGFLQHLLLENGVFDAVEVATHDDRTRARGHIDATMGGRLVEIKTMNERKLRKIDTVDDFRDHCPDYYYQGQEYLRMTGQTEEVILIVTTSYPFVMKELIMPADLKVQAEVRDKYEFVLQSVADQIVPTACCAPRSAQSKVCPARGVCEIGMV